MSIPLAETLAIKFHSGQKYGANDYTFHLEEVVTSVSHGTTDDRLIVVAWLHDILEDTECTADVLSALFEDHIVHAVVAMTRIAGESRDDYLVKVKANSMARMVKIHDSLCNLRASVMRFDSKRIKKYTAQINFLVT